MFLQGWIRARRILEEWLGSTGTKLGRVRSNPPGDTQSG